MKRGKLPALVAAAFLLAAGAAAMRPAGAAAEATGARVNVFVSIPPLEWLARRIGASHVDVSVLVGPGQSPHTFEPTPKQTARLAEAQIYFLVGMPFEERLLEKVRTMNPRLKIVDLREGIALRWMTPAESAAHEAEEAREDPGHAAGEKHEADPAHAGEADPHTWLNPLHFKIQAAAVARALEQADPSHADEYKKNLTAVQAELDDLNARVAKALAPLKGKQFFVYHPAFGYFADAYGLRQVPVEIEGKVPTARQLAALIDRARRLGVRVIFVQPQFSTKTADALAKAIGGAVVPMDDLARDYLGNLGDMAEKIRQAIGNPE